MADTAARCSVFGPLRLRRVPEVGEQREMEMWVFVAERLTSGVRPAPGRRRRSRGARGPTIVRDSAGTPYWRSIRGRRAGARSMDDSLHGHRDMTRGQKGQEPDPRQHRKPRPPRATRPRRARCRYRSRARWAR
jgi:hypothetical protein